MKKFPIVLAICIVIMIAIIAIAAYLNPRSDDNNRMDSNGLTAIQKAKAINIALSDPTIKKKILSHAGNSNIGNVTVSGVEGESGYANSSDMILSVPFQFSDSRSYMGNERMNMYVDLNTSSIIGSVWYSYRGFPMDAEVTIPPGAFWYSQIVGGMVSSNGALLGDGTLQLSPWVSEIKPENSSIYPTIVDKENLSLFLHHSPYQALVYYDNIANKTTSTKGDIAYNNNWSSQITLKVNLSPNGSSWPSYDVPDIYLLLRNGYTDRNIVVSLH